jgi:DDE superfamily endonuclease
VGDLTGRGRSDIYRIVKLVASMIVAKWWAALLLDPHRLTRARPAQYARVIEADGCPYDKLVGFLDGSRYSISRHRDAAIQAACYSAKYKTNVAYQAVVAPDGILMDFDGPFAGSKADGSVFRDSTLHLPLIAIFVNYHIFSDTAYPASLQVVTGYKATENVEEIA